MSVDTLYLGPHTQSLILIDMPSIDLGPIWGTIPELTKIHLQNVDCFTKENFLSLQRRVASYKGLEHLGLELISFDIEEVKREFLVMMEVHADSLKHLWLGRNKSSNAFIKDVCSTLTTVSGFTQVLESISL